MPLVLSSVVHRDRYPQLLSFSMGLWLLQYIDKVVDVLGTRVAQWKLVKEFHMFSTCCSRSSPGIWTLFLEPLVLAATCACALRQSTEAFGRISSIFYVKSGPGSPCSSHLESWNYFYEQYLAVTASVHGAFWKNFIYFHRVGCPGFNAQFALENLDIIFTCCHMAVGWGFSAALTHSSRSSRLVKSSSPSRAPLAN